MELEQTAETESSSPQWLGSLVRRGEQAAAQGSEPVFDDEAGTQWLGSVARREDAQPDPAPTTGEGWTGSSERSALFMAPRPAPAPLAVPGIDVAPTNVHELPGRERIVMGALGMTLRVAA